MKKAVMIVLCVGFFVATLANAQRVPSQVAGSSNNGHLYVFEKNPADWTIVEGGAWGKMLYNQSGPTLDFVFNGHRLNTGQEYTLIYYPDPWPGNNLVCFGSGTADLLGDVTIKENKAILEDLPLASDDNFGTGAKIWLVLPADVNCPNRTMSGWTPGDYLFEYNLFLTYTYSP